MWEKEIEMPVISIFYGIMIYMYYIDSKKHKKPHIHVHYQEKEAVVSIPDGEVLLALMREVDLLLHGFF